MQNDAEDELYIMKTNASECILYLYMFDSDLRFIF